MALVSQDLDAQGRAIEHDGLLMPVEQRPAYQVMHGRSQPTFGSCRCLGLPPQIIFMTGQ